MLRDAVADIEEVAAALGRSPQWLRRNWLSYAIKTGFPRKLPHTWVWPRRAVEAFLSQQRPAPPAANISEIIKDQLSQRYGGRG